MPAVGDQLLLMSGLKILQFLLRRKTQVAPRPAGSRDGDVKPRWTGTEYAHGLVPADE